MKRTKTHRVVLRSATACCALLLCLTVGDSPVWGDWRDDVGYTKLISLLGDSAPNGAGVPISLVEAGSNDAYFPNVDDVEFNSATDPLGIGVVFTDGSGGESNGASGHSHAQAKRFFGNTQSLAPAANAVTVYGANDYLEDVLNINGNNNTLPDAQNFRVQNFSWIGTFVTDSNNPSAGELNDDREALRRFDYAIDTNNITALVGIQNAATPLPHLLSHSYNSITVGRSIGNHSTGYTRLVDYGVGRSKPDLVAPQSTTSAATASTSSAATFLHSSSTVLGTDAAKSATMKALLLAGATKDDLLKDGLPTTWSQVDASGDWHPLDDTFGAGELNVYNSYLVTLGGQAVGSTTTPTAVGSHGWDYQTVQPGSGNALQYDFVVPVGSVAEELSIVLAWNAKTEAPFNIGDPILADLTLELVDDTGTTVDLNLDDGVLLDGLSNSSGDNVEHLYLTDLSAGTYTLKVSSEDLASDFGLAWRTATAFNNFSADFDEDGDADGADFLSWQRGFRTLVGATHADGDTNGDGDVDADDLAFLRDAMYGGAPSPIGLLASVPEPAGWILLCMGLLLVLGLRDIRSRVGLRT